MKIKITIISCLAFCIVACQKKENSSQPEVIPPTARCDTSSTASYAYVPPEQLAFSTYTEISNPFSRRYKFTTDSTILYTYLTSSNPVKYDSVSLRFRYHMMSSYSLSRNDTAHDASFYVACVGSNRTGYLFDTLFIISNIPTRQVFALKRSN